MNKDKFKKSVRIGISVFLLAGIFIIGFYFGGQDKSEKRTEAKTIAYSEEAKNQAIGNPDDVFDFNLYFEVWDNLKKNYVDKNKIKDKELFYGSLEGLAAATGDPYTVFMDPKSTQEFYGDLSGTFEGIGAEVGMRNDIVTVIAPLDGMPAQKAGLRSGDKIYAIDGQSALGMTVNEAVKMIRGQKETKVTLTIIRGSDKPKDIVITRGLIVVESVKTTMRSDGIFIIKVSNFNDDTSKLFNKAVETAVLKKPKGLILDLRNNPGGYLNTAIEMASEWVEAGPVVSEQFGENRRNEHFSNGRARLKNIPTVVLINEGSASASEIVAGALRDYKLATLVGQKTFGKGSVQTLQDLSDGSSLKITVAKWLTPAGDFINEKGIEADVKVEMKQEDLDKNRDPQLNKALDILKLIKNKRSE